MKSRRKHRLLSIKKEPACLNSTAGSLIKYFIVLLVFAFSAATAGNVWVSDIAEARREKFIGREFNAFKYIAWIVARRCAFLIRYAEIVCRDQKLYFAFKPYNGEQSQCNQGKFDWHNIAAITVKPVGKQFGQLHPVHGAVGIYKPCRKENRVNGFYDCCRGLIVAETSMFVVAVVG